VSVSLLTHKEDFNMDRLLHHGSYAKIKKLVGEEVKPVPGRKAILGLLGRLIGIDENFTLGDKWFAGSLFIWNMSWFSLLVIGSIWNLLAPWPIAVWSIFWHVVALGIPICLTVVSCLWFTWGGLRDLSDFFRHLREKKINPLDDGTVVDHQNLDESLLKDEAMKAKPITSTNR